MVDEPGPAAPPESPPVIDTPLGVPTGARPAGRAGVPPVQRVRITFAKGAEIRFIGHLDVVRLWERAARRARLPLAYTLGFTPHPRFAFAAPLALGATGARELMDAYFTQEVPLADLHTRLQAQLPPACLVVDLQPAPLDAPALMSLVRWAEYHVEVTAPLAADPASGGQSDTETAGDRPGSRWSRRTPGSPTTPTEEDLATLAETGSPWRPPAERLAPLPPPQPIPSRDELQARIARFLAAEHAPLPRERQGKIVEHDLRPSVLDLWLASRSEFTGHRSQVTVPLGMLLRAGEGGAGRPEEITTALGVRPRRIHRVRVGLEGEELVASSE